MKIFKIIFLFVLFLCTLLCVDEIIYTPLNKKYINDLFFDYRGKIDCCYKKDFIGWSRGDIFDFSIYTLDNAKVSLAYPVWDEFWISKNIHKENVFYTKWRKCQIDSIIYGQYNFMLNEIISKTSYGKIFEEELNKESNYFSVLYINPMEMYFFLYNPTLRQLYYSRKIGF